MSPPTYKIQQQVVVLIEVQSSIRSNRLSTPVPLKRLVLEDAAFIVFRYFCVGIGYFTNRLIQLSSLYKIVHDTTRGVIYPCQKVSHLEIPNQLLSIFKRVHLISPNKVDPTHNFFRQH